MLLTKNLKPKTKNFFSLLTWRLAESFKGLNIYLTHLALELCPHKAHVNSLIFVQTAWINMAAKVLNSDKVSEMSLFALQA